MNDKTESVDEKKPRLDRTVTIYGAGVAGLTAAHELVERGFSVTVVEPEPNPVVPKDCAVGGMARTQWSRAARVDNPQQRLEDSALAASQPIPRFLGAEEARHGPAPYGLDLFFKEGSCTWTSSVLGFPGYADIRVDELVELIAQIPEIDPFNRKRLAPVEVVQVIGTWAEDDVPQGPAGEPQTLDVIRVGDEERRVDDILQPEEMEMCATPLERWRRALAMERCRRVIAALCTRLEEVCPGRFEFVKTPHGNDTWVLRRSMQLVARLEMAVVGNVAAKRRAGDPDEQRFVRVVVDHIKLPGEHGYRFFPAFYSHVFDTMKRIPITEPEPRDPVDYQRDVEVWLTKRRRGQEAIRPDAYQDTPQGRTVRDNLISLTAHTITGPGGEAFKLTRTASLSVRGVLQILRDFQRAMDLSYRDIARMQVKMLQYLTSCPARRDVYSRMTWLEYLGGPYSDGFKQAMITWPKALVGLQADKADARTYGDVAVQLVLDQLRSDAYRDGTLNGPTSVAWLEPWRVYLQQQGVTFKRGRLLDLELSGDGSITPLEMRPDAGPTRCAAMAARRPHYIVLAVPPVEARQLSVSLREQARAIKGQVWADFVASDFAPMCDLLDADGKAFDLKDLGDERLAGVLQHYGGIQFFLDQDYRLFNGHAYYPDAAWALSSISQVQFRMDPPDPREGYRGVVSVDVGSWDTLGLDKLSAWQCSGDQFATEVWRQICASMGVGHPGAKDRPSTPRWYHIDEGILRGGAEHARKDWLGIENYPEVKGPEDEVTKRGRALRNRAENSPILAIDRAAAELRAKAESDVPYFNRTPYLVSLAGAWARSPGRPGDYRLTYGVVMAGTHMRTHTRLATMEAANESARHAVNAIMADYRQRVSQKERERLDIRVGEPCETWPLVDRELDDLSFLKKVDAALLRQGLPHMFEILEVEQIVDELVPRGEGVGGATEGQVDVVDKIVGVLEQLGAAKPSSAGAFMLAPLQALLATLRLRR